MGPTLAINLVLALALGADSPRSAVLMANPATFQATLARAKGGDTIVLAPGEYRDLMIRNAQYRPALKVDARQAKVTGLRLMQTKGVEIEGGRFQPVPPAPQGRGPAFGHAISVNGSSDVVIKAGTFKGPGDETPTEASPFGAGYGVYARNSQNVSVLDGRFIGLKTGVVVMTVDGFKVSGNDFIAMRSDGLQIAESRRGLIEDNECRSTRIREKEHPDCIQAWSRSNSPPTADLVIRRNRVRGHTQGIGFFNHVRNGVDDGGFDRILIENNDVEIWYPHAIFLGSARDSIVRNNRVRTVAGGKYRATIKVFGNVVQCGNQVASAAGKPGFKDNACRGQDAKPVN